MMKYREIIHQGCLYFSSWSKKGYSIFASLGREVHISRLALHMYEKVLLKAATKGLIVNMDAASEVVFSEILRENADFMISGKRGDVYPDVIRIVMK